jgi:hypothetical protein
LTQREIEILRLLGAGKSLSEIAWLINASYKTNCKYVFHHAPEAWLALILRTRALCDREPAGVT